MTTSPSEPDDQQSDKSPSDGERDRSEPEPTSEPGSIGDEQLPEDLQPTDANPLAKDPGQEGEDGDPPR